MTNHFAAAANSRATLALAARIVEAAQTCRESDEASVSGGPFGGVPDSPEEHAAWDKWWEQQQVDHEAKYAALDALLRQWASDAGTGEDV